MKGHSPGQCVLVLFGTLQFLFESVRLRVDGLDPSPGDN
jgi:hypothetical protein